MKKEKTLKFANRESIRISNNLVYAVSDTESENSTPPVEFPDETPNEFAQRLKLPFQDNFLLSRALTHRSYLNEHPEALEDNERLEFLGDAVLDFLVASWVYHRFPEMPEGELTRMRSGLVHTERLASFARLIDLRRAMRLGRGESHSGGYDKSALLCDTFEAVVGALYLENGFQAVEKFLEPFLEMAINDLLMNIELTDPKSQLQEWAQAQGYAAPKYRTKEETGPEHRKHFVVGVYINGKVFGTGEGYSKQAAEKNAAADAIHKNNIIN
ncbi:MAG: ribonuclease III [Chloroflexi bacterium]|nr:ribonuclease III [Chloroflexota bacterium]